MSDLSERLMFWIKAANDLVKAEENCGQYDRSYFTHSERRYLKDMENAFLESLSKSLEEVKKNKVQETEET